MGELSNKKIVILGATEYVAPLIIKANSLGAQTHVFAWEKGDIGERVAYCFYPISVANHEAVLNKCLDIHPDAVISLGSDTAALAAAYLSEQLNLPGNSLQTVKNTVNKLTFRRLMEEKGINQPKFIGIGDEYPKKDSKSMSFPLIVKPTDRSASRGVKKIFNRTDLFKAIAEAREVSKEGKAIIEEYINGRHFSCECITFNGIHQIVAYTKRNNFENYSEFIEHEYIQPAVLTEEQKHRIQNVVFKVLDILGIKNGASSTEFFLDHNEEVIILEVNPSMYGDFIGTDLVEITTGYDYMKMSLCTALGKEPGSLPPLKPREARIRIILSREDVRDLNEVLSGSGSAVIKYKFFCNSEDIPEKADGGRYGFFIFGEDPEKMEGK